MFLLLKLVTENSIWESHIGADKLSAQKQRELMLTLVTPAHSVETFCL